MEYTLLAMENETQQQYEDRLEAYRDNHENDHYKETRTTRDIMDLRDDLDAYGYN